MYITKLVKQVTRNLTVGYRRSYAEFVGYELVNIYAKMTFLAKLFVFIFIALVYANSDSKNKLQIGIKKRIENCNIKSKKGDFLQMHYRVGITKVYLERVLKSVI